MACAAALLLFLILCTCASKEHTHTHTHTAGEDEALEDVLSREGAAGKAGLDSSRHFSYYALEGGSGTERWHHTSEDFHKDLPELAVQ
eukprot:985843-Pelagomonas_calceolata.AAC.2